MTGEHIFSNWGKQRRWITFSITKYGWLGHPLLWDPGKEKKITFVEKFFRGSAVWGRPTGLVGFPRDSVVKNHPAKQERQVWSLGWKDPLEEGMAAHSGILAWRIPWAEEPGRLQYIGSQRVGHDWSNLAHMHVYMCVCVCMYFFRLFPLTDFYKILSIIACRFNTVGFCGLSFYI